MSWKTSSEVFTIGAKIEKSTNVIIHCIAVFTWNTDSSALGGPWQLLSTEKGSEVSGLSPSWDGMFQPGGMEHASGMGHSLQSQISQLRGGLETPDE